MHHADLVSQRVMPATVRADPCRVEIDYRLPRTDRNYSDYLGMYFPCSVNRFGAYVCASHAFGLPGDPPRTKQNARYVAATGTIRLDRPPSHPVSVREPACVRRYRVIDGFIQPFDSEGKLRAGLTLGRSVSLACETFAGHPEASTLLACGGGLSCFVPRLPVRNGQLLACPTSPGSRTFERGRLDVHPQP
jgi:hypothetical protein